MSKRKREEDEDDGEVNEIEDRALRIKVSRLKAKVDQGNKSLATALKFARGFERQKLGRRQKSASNEPQTLLRLREEVIVLKELDAVKTAKNYLFKQLAKTKRIRESAAFIAVYGTDPRPDGPKNAAEGNLLGRLFKSNSIKELLPGIMKGIYGVLSLDDTKRKAGDNSKRIRSQSSMDTAPERPNLRVLEVEDFEGFSDGARSADKGIDEDVVADSDEEDVGAYNDRLASSSDISDDENNIVIDSTARNGMVGQSHDRPRMSISPSISEGSSEDLQLPKRHTGGPVKPISTTAFLPSLSMGGYYSGSESGDDDDDNYTRAPAITQQRKNRRGQRARQQIAEKKFGKKAKHLQNQKPKVGQEAVWDAKKGAVDARDPRKRKVGRGRPIRTTGPTGANEVAVSGARMRAKPAEKKNDGPIHPSWEAARKKKIENSKHMSAFAGKKTTFD